MTQENGSERHIAEPTAQSESVKVTSLCPYFGSCGGCSAQHIAYEVQVQNKRKLVSVATGVPIDKVEAYSGEPYFYRNRMDFIVHPRGIGLRKAERWQEVIDIEQCPISDKRLNALITEVRAFLQSTAKSDDANGVKSIDAFDQRRGAGTFKYVVIRTPTIGSSISFVLNTQSTKIDEATQQIERFAKTTSADSVLIAYVQKERDIALSEDFVVVKGSDMIKERMDVRNEADPTDRVEPKELIYSTQAFFQNNSKMAQEMIKYVRSIVKSHPDHKKYNLLDLYGGVGTFGICIADLVKSTHIVESVQQAIDAANHNIKHNDPQGTHKITAQVLDAAQIKKLVGKPSVASPLIVITDPPRSGMDQKTVECLNKQLSPDLLIYISCNPQQLEKELPRLTNYDIVRTAMFDLFPQTNHAEAVVVLKKK